MAGDGLVHQEPVLRELRLDFVLGQDVFLDADVEFGGRFTGRGSSTRGGAKLPYAQVGLRGERQLDGGHAVLVGVHRLLEYLYGFGILDLDDCLGRHRLEFRVESHQPHVDGLPRFVDGLVALQEEQRAWLDLDGRRLGKALTGHLDPVLTGCHCGDLQRQGALAVDITPGRCEDGLALAENRHGDLAFGQVLPLEQREREGRRLSRAQSIRHQRYVAVDGIGPAGSRCAGQQRRQQEPRKSERGEDSPTFHGTPPSGLECPSDPAVRGKVPEAPRIGGGSAERLLPAARTVCLRPALPVYGLAVGTDVPLTPAAHYPPTAYFDYLDAGKGCRPPGGADVQEAAAIGAQG